MKHILFILFQFLILNSSFSIAAIPLAPVLQTGQGVCYDDAGTAINCAGTGQDGEMQNGLPWPSLRFTDRINGTVKDNLTGLVWLRDANCFGIKNWADALISANALASGACGLTDDSTAGKWRLPNKIEIQSLVDRSRSNPSLPSGHPFSNVQTNHPYISSSTYANFPDSAWLVNMDKGTMTFRDMNSSYISLVNKNYASSYVWPVRDEAISTADGVFKDILPKTGISVNYALGDDGAFLRGVQWPNPRFGDNSDGTITDKLTGLIWLKDAKCFDYEVWPVALSEVNTLSTGTCGLTDGSSPGDWSIPNVNELESLIDAGSQNVVGFPFSNVLPENYWTSTISSYFGPYNNSSMHWFVNMNGGTMGIGGNFGYVMPVRSLKYFSFDPLILSVAPKFGPLYDVVVPIQPRQVDIGNRSSTLQAVTAIAISGTNAAEFFITIGGTTPCSSFSPTLEAGESCTLLLGFRPTSSGVKSVSLDITSNGVTKNIPLTGTSITTIYGTVTNQSTGLPVASANITLNTSTTTRTDQYGNYSFGNLPAGAYNIMVNKPILDSADGIGIGYQATMKDGLSVNSTTSVKADFLLPTVGTLNITTATLPSASPNIPFRCRVMVGGGTAPYTFSMPYGNLPAGISLDNSTGTISGTPTGSGSYTFAIGVSDNVLGYSEKEYTVELLPPLQIITASLQPGKEGVFYTSAIIATGGKPTISFNSIVRDSFLSYFGSFPKGMTFSSNGTISGTPSEYGSFNFTVKVSDSTGKTSEKPFILALAAADTLTLDTTSLQQGYIGANFLTILSSSGGVPPYIYKVIGTLPTGLSLDSSTGIISGTPSAAGLTNLTFIVNDSAYPPRQYTSGIIPLRIWSEANGSCGASNNGTFTVAPTTDFCTTGTSTAVSGTGPWGWTCAGINGGTTANCSASIADATQFSVTPTTGTGFTISPAIPQTVTNNGSTSFSVTQQSGYGILSVSGCGGSLNGGTYTTGPITVNCMISVTAVARNANSDGAAQPPTISDALKVLQSVVGITPLTATEQIRYDVAPLAASGTPLGNGVLDAADVVAILRRSIGIGSW